MTDTADPAPPLPTEAEVIAETPLVAPKSDLVANRMQEYEILISGYHSRDEVVSQTFFEMMQVFVFFLALNSAANIVVNEKILFVVYIVLSLTGFVAMMAFLLDLQGNASARRALRQRCCEIELELGDTAPKYWFSIRDRPKFFEESLFKPKLSNTAMERLASSDFFIVAARFVLIAWITFSLALIVNNYQTVATS